MEDQHQYRKSNVSHRNYDDWDEVHNQMLEVQQKGLIQKKSLAVSAPGDADEKEADEVARKVMSGESATIHGTGGTINRKGTGNAETSPEFQSKLESSKGKGQSLPENLQNELGQKMGANFSGVKIHTGGEAHAMNENVNAKAFTHGQDVYFREGEYNTQSSAGKELLAHELVHTVQQNFGEAGIQRTDHVDPVEKTVTVTEGATAVELINSIGEVVKTYSSGGIGGFSFTVGNEVPAGLYSIRFTSSSDHIMEKISKTDGTDITVHVKVAHDTYRYEKGKIETLSDILTLYPRLTNSVIDEVPASVIMQTAEFKALMKMDDNWQLCYNLDYDEAVYVCRKVLKEMIKIPAVFVWDSDVEQIIIDALKTQGSAHEEAAFYTRPLSPDYESLCTNFEGAIGSATGSNIETLVRDYANALWRIDRDKRDDGSLYVARIRGRRALKTNTELTASREGILQMVKMLQLLDDASRGREDVVFEDNDDIRILVSGFDPFQGKETNPSGAVVQMIDGTTMTYTQGSATKTARIEGVIFPTKYSDFDKGAVENFFDPYLDPKQGKKIFAVVTISQDSNEPYGYYLERHAARYRGSAIRDNAGIGTSEFLRGGVYQTPTYKDKSTDISKTAGVRQLINQNLNRYESDTRITNPNWKFITIETLDKIKALFSYISFSTCPPLPALITTKDQSFNYLDSVDQWLKRMVPAQQQELLPFPSATAGKEFYSTSFDLENFPTSGTGLVKIRNTYSDFPDKTEIDSPTVDPEAQQPGKSYKGSGSNFMSNEIYYRVSVLAEKYGRAVPNVHLHIPHVGSTGTPTKDKLKEHVQSAIKLALESHVHE